MPITSIRESKTATSFKRSFAKLSSSIQNKVISRTALFEINSRHPSLNTHKLKGKLKDRWSFNVDRRHRVVFKFVNGDEVVYYDVGTHEVYR